jgi:hypothetical protein
LTIWNGYGYRGKRDDPNAFTAMNERGEVIGTATVTEMMMPHVFPDRPHHLFVEVDADEESMDALISAVTARSIFLARSKPDVPAHIYTECAAQDERKLEILRTLGYRDEDALVRMWRALSSGPVIKPMPLGCTYVRDALEDESERAYFLKRFNALFAQNLTEKVLQNLRATDGFQRLMLVNASGLMGEMLLWHEGDTGVVGSIETNVAYRKSGVAGYLMELAREYWTERGVRAARFDVWTRLDAAERLAASSGYKRVEVLCRRPGLDIG